MNKERDQERILRCATHVELLRTRALLTPEKRAYTYLVDGENVEAHLTFAELDRQARVIAAFLQEQGAEGKPVLLLYQPGLEYLSAFFGCLYAGAIAIPAYPPRLNHNLERIEAIIADAKPALALSSQAFATPAMRIYLTTSHEFGKLPLLITDSLADHGAAQWREPACTGETLAFLQYTSGSTGKPKGIMVTHQNLLYNHRMFAVGLQHPEHVPFVCWLPFFHDLGLIGHALQALYQGVPCVFMSPLAFLQQPYRWLNALSRYKAYTSYAPNFAYDLCVQKVTPEQRATLDLSHWHNAGNAAEPIRYETLERFAETFAECGFRREAFLPGYGLAEATLVVTTADSGQPTQVKRVRREDLELRKVVLASPEERQVQNIVDSGHTWLEQKIVVVDPEICIVCPPGQIGEIWISGPNVTLGYWKHPEETEETFGAHLADSGEGPFLRTGDMGFLDNGELFVTGRLKDLIIIRGQNYYPQDIEMIAEQSHFALRQNCSAAFSLENAGEEVIILVLEIERQYRHHLPEGIFLAIRQAVLEAYELHIHGIVLIKPGSLPKTSSGKIQRRTCRTDLLAQKLSIVSTDMPASVAQLIGYHGSGNAEASHPPLAAVPNASEERLQEERHSDQPSAPPQPVLRDLATRPEERKKMQFSLLYFASDEAESIDNKYELFLEGARFADQHEFTAVWIPERHFHPFGGLYPNPSLLAAALAIATKNVRLRAGSVVLPMHHPARVAEEWSVVDNLSAGRVDLAFATGWNPNDFALAPEQYARRKELLFSGLEIFHKLWQGAAVTYPNGLGQQTEIKIYPQPRQPALTPWITCTGNPERFVEAGALGANILTGLLFQTQEELAEKIALYRETRARHGHDPASGHVTLMLHTFIDEDMDEVRRKVKPPFLAYLESSVDLWRHERKQLDNLTPQERESVLAYAFERYFQTHALFGTPKSCAEKVASLGEIGVDEIAALIDFGLDTPTVLDGLQWLNVLRRNCQKKDIVRQNAGATANHQPPQAVAHTIPVSSPGEKIAAQPVVQEQEALALNTRPSTSTPQLVEQLAGASHKQCVHLIGAYLRQQVALVLERSIAEIADVTNIRGLALDSLNVMNIVNNCQRDLQIMPDAGRFYELTTFEDLTLYLVDEYKRVHGSERTLQTGDLHPALRRQERQMRFPQSFAQQRMWLQQQLQPDSIAYNVPTAIKITGKLDSVALQQSLEVIVQRHEILRTTFDLYEGQPVQIIHAAMPFSLPVTDLSMFDEQAREEQVQMHALREARQPFDLVHGPLLRVSLLVLSATEHMLLLTYHHIVADGWARGIFMRDLQALYTSFTTSQPAALPELPLQYADFAVWQIDWLQSPASSANGQQGSAEEPTLLEKQLVYWKTQLAGPPPVVELPKDRPRPPTQTFRGAHLSIHVPPTLMAELRAFSQREHTTLFMTLLASFQVLLVRYSGQEDISVGSPIAGRTRVETEALMGYFVNTLVLRTNLSDNPTFRDVLQRVRGVCLAAYAHQDVPFEKVVDAVYPRRDLNLSPLFQIMFGLHDAAWWYETEVEGLTLRQVEMESGIAALDLTWAMTDSGFGLIEYSSDLFDASTIVRMLEHWYVLLRAIVLDPLQHIAAIPLLTDEEREQALVGWNATRQDYGRPLCLHQLFEQQVGLTPHAIALKTATSRLTYREVEARANQLAHMLVDMGVEAGARVGVCMSKGPEAIIALLAILKAGCIYVPLDPLYPHERLTFMLEDAQICALIIKEAVKHALPEHRLPMLYLENSWFSQQDGAVEPLKLEMSVDWLAYMIYTSGSTGVPKGVQVSHRGLQNLVEVQKHNFELQADDQVLQFSSLSFDASIWEVCMALCTGATLCIETEESVLAGSVLQEVLKRLEITVVTLPPSTLASLPQDDLYQLRTIIVAGEACSPELVAQWSRGRRFFNAYGPTEATVCATLERCNGDTQTIALGRSIANMQTYILDASLQPVPIGVAGELYLGGSSLAYGYLHRPDLTAERFVPHPFAEQESARLYKTGDRARYRADGTLEFLGRMDNQVKVRGYRIEPGEIEAVLLRSPDVRECVVLVQDQSREGKRLVAYVTPHANRGFSSEAIRAYLLQHLPEYMVPSLILALEHMPLTPNGKIDRARLPDMEALRRQSETALQLPSSASERAIASIWQECLRLKTIGRDENFFELGAHSLLVVQVLQKLQDHFQRDIALTDLFEYPTVSALSSYLDQEARSQQVMREQNSSVQLKQKETLKVGKDRLQSMRLKKIKGNSNG